MLLLESLSDLSLSSGPLSSPIIRWGRRPPPSQEPPWVSHPKEALPNPPGVVAVPVVVSDTGPYRGDHPSDAILMAERFLVKASWVGQSRDTSGLRKTDVTKWACGIHFFQILYRATGKLHSQQLLPLLCLSKRVCWPLLWGAASSSNLKGQWLQTSHTAKLSLWGTEWGW